MEDFSQDDLAAAFADNRQRLLALAEKRLNPILLKRLSVEDAVSLGELISGPRENRMRLKALLGKH